jgi:hypothetical protein
MRTNQESVGSVIIAAPMFDQGSGYGTIGLRDELGVLRRGYACPVDRSASGRWAVDKIGALVAELRTSAQVRSPFA